MDKDSGSREKPTAMDILEDGRDAVREVTKWTYAPARVKLLSGLMHQLG